jgi:hypothetical protein
MTRCSECRTDHPDGVEVCPSCGRSPEPVRCSRCGERYFDSDSCPLCGTVQAGFTCDVHEESSAEGRCLICGTLLCRVCRKGSTRVHLCAEHSEVELIQGWAQIYTTASGFEAQLLRENLLAEGVDAQIFSQKDQMFSVDFGELSIVRLLVPAWEYEQAQKVIRERMNSDGEVAFACARCGEAFEPGLAQCESCGAVLPLSGYD